MDQWHGSDLSEPERQNAATAFRFDGPPQTFSRMLRAVEAERVGFADRPAVVEEISHQKLSTAEPYICTPSDTKLMMSTFAAAVVKVGAVAAVHFHVPLLAVPD